LFYKKKFWLSSNFAIKKSKKKLIFRDKNTLLNIKTISVKHGAIHCNSYIINSKCAYVSDVNFIYNKDIKNFINLNYLVVDCLRIDKHPSHYNLEDVLKLIDILKPKKSILTNLHADLDYNYLIKVLPKNVIPAYDGMSFFI
jgi:phosphoribosyl 1,2-cyclic phosphate phosphodiesterase